jgi:hypothetical protein
MTRAPRRALLLVLMVVLAAAALAVAAERHRWWAAKVPPTRRPALLLLTSLPLLFNEDFSLNRGGSPALKALHLRYRVVPISVTDPAELARGGLLLMAQPQAQTPENLVGLDAWVRLGGRLLLLADPMLEWPSKLPLGDPLRPPAVFMDTGLLVHWGLRLDAPDHRGPAQRKLASFEVMTDSPGSLSGSCDISGDRLVARCRIGRGRVRVIADADLLDVDQLGTGGDRNLDGLLAELALVARK